MSTHLVLEAAVRSLVMGAMIMVALRLLRIDQVRARRTAWLLALIGALAMPVLVGAQIGPRLLPQLAFVAPPVAQPTAQPAAESEALRPMYGDYRGPLSESRAGTAQDTAALMRSPAIEDNRDGAEFGGTALSLVVFGYCVVAAVRSAMVHWSAAPFLEPKPSSAACTLFRVFFALSRSE